LLCSLVDASSVSLNQGPPLQKLQTLELTRLTDYNIGIVQMMVSKAPNLKSINIKKVVVCYDITFVRGKSNWHEWHCCHDLLLYLFTFSESRIFMLLKY